MGGKHRGTKGTPGPAPLGTPLQAGEGACQEQVTAKVEELGEREGRGRDRGRGREREREWEIEGEGEGDRGRGRGRGR